MSSETLPETAELATQLSLYEPNYDDDIRHLEKKLQRDSSNTDLQSTLFYTLLDYAAELLEKKDYVRAKLFYEKALQTPMPDPGVYGEVHFSLGSLLFLKEEYEKALLQFEKSAAINSFYRYDIGRYGLELAQKDEADLAIKYLQKSLTGEPADADVYNNTGNIYINKKGDVENAIEQYNQALRVDPGYVYALHNLGYAYSLKGEVDTAISFYHKATESDKNYTEAYLALALIYSSLQRYGEAKAQYSRVLEINPANTKALAGLSGLARKENEPDLAISYLEQLLAIDKKDVVSFNDLGNLYFDYKKDYDKAIEQYEAALSVDEKFIYAIYNLGTVYSVKGDLDQSIAYYEKAIATDPLYTPSYVELANIYLGKNDFDKAITLYENALKAVPGFTKAFHHLGLAYSKMDDKQKAIYYFEQAIAAGTISADIYNDLGNIYYGENKPDDAIKNYEEAVKIDPGFKFAYYNMGLSYNKKGDFKNAVANYEKAITADNSYADAYNALGNLYFDNKDYEKAKFNYESSNTLNPKGSNALYSLGLIYSIYGDRDTAITFYNKAIEADEKNANAYNALGNIYYDLKEFDKAITYYEKSLEIEPNLIQAMYNLGLTYTEKEDITNAAVYLERVLSIDDTYTLSYVSLGNLYLYQSKEYDKALEQFRKVIAKTPKDNKEQLAEAYYNLGNLNFEKLNYADALSNYEQALNLNADHSFAQHNIAAVYEKIGQYRTSKTEWMKASRLYEKAIQKKDGSNHAFHLFYYAEILNYYIPDTDERNNPALIEKCYLEAIEKAPASIFMRLSLLKYYLKRKEECAESREQENAESNRYHIKALQEYRKGVELLKQQVNTGKTRTNLLDLADFYLTMEQYTDAATCLEQVLQIDPDTVKARIALGVVQSKTENYMEAIKNFKKALSLDPDDLNVQTNLADSYLKSDKFSLAEQAYKRVINIAPGNLDALLGLGEYYKKMADKTPDDSKNNDTEEFLQQSKEMFEAALKKNEEAASSSKRLTAAELSAINYSLGYVHVKQYELNNASALKKIDRSGNKGNLKTAQSLFRNISHSQPDYYKAQTAIKKIEKHFSVQRQAVRKYAPFFVFMISLFVCLIIQFCFLWGRPQRKEIFVANKSNLEQFLSANKIGVAAGTIASWSAKSFETPDEATEKLSKILPVNDSLAASFKEFVIEKDTAIKFEPIDAVAYGSLTFGALIFMVVGLYLAEISKLKVGSIELEKTTADTISTSPGLGIRL